MSNRLDYDTTTTRTQARAFVIADAWRTCDAATLIATRRIIAAVRKADLRMLFYGGPAIIVVTVPRDDLATFAAAARAVSTRSCVLRQSTFIIDDKGKIRHEGRWGLDDTDIRKSITEDTHCWIVTTSPDKVPAFAREMADGEIVVDALSAGDICMASLAMTGMPMPRDLAARYVPLGLQGVATSLKRGVPQSAALERMNRLLKVMEASGELAGQTSGPRSTDPVRPPEQPALEDLHGLGEAAEWGRELALDLADYRAGKISWAEVDRGVLLSGPPGCGKTTFARALGKTCGVPVHVHSLAQWQAAGYLNALLKAMHDAFRKAQDDAPSVLFIDELDSFGDRTKFVGDSASYCTEVVNALLECLDGADRREGVVVVGATNYPDNLDAAMRRAGRLDRHIEIPMPDAEARKGILGFHLRGTPLDLTAAAIASEGLSGADLEKAVREARRRARRARRALAEADLLAALPPLIERSPDAYWRTCVHEAGHALLASHYGMTASISTPAKIALTASGSAWVDTVRGIERDEGDMIDEHVVLLLAGLAAEQLVLGRFGLGGGGDLRKATLLVATLHATLGTSGRLTVLAEPDTGSVRAALRRDALLRAAVEKTLKQRFAEALAILSARKPALLTLADAARTTGHVSADDVARILAAAPAPERKHRQIPR